MMTSLSVENTFTFENIEAYFQAALNQGYDIITCRDYIHYKKTHCQHKILVNRVDIDVSVKKAYRLASIFNKLAIKASFFVRLHANEYNPFSFENYRILKFIRDSGHEIGYHSEVNDEAMIWQETAESCLKRDLDILNKMLNINTVGVASHGGMTGINNLDFWKDKTPQSFGLLYEAYDTQPDFDLYNHSFYISDSCWTYWKCYHHGKLINNDRRSLGEHVNDNHPIIYSLIHPETYYDLHFYE